MHGTETIIENDHVHILLFKYGFEFEIYKFKILENFEPFECELLHCIENI